MALSSVKAANAAAIVPGMKFKLKQRVSENLIKLEDNTEYLMRIDAAMQLAEDNGQKDRDGKPKKPPMLMSVTFLDTGESGKIIVPQLLERDLKNAFHDDSYVGKFFQISKVKIPTKGGQTVNVFEIAELEIDDTTMEVSTTEVATEAADTGKKKK